MWPVVRGVDNNRVVGDAKVIHRLEYLSNYHVVFDHSVSVFRPRIEARLVPKFGPYMRSEVHPRRVEPAKEWAICPSLALHEINGGGRRLIVNRLHALLGEWAGVLDFPVR